MPETKGKTLEEMDQVFGSHSSVAQLEEFAKVQERVGLTALIQGQRPSALSRKDSSIEKESDEKVEHVTSVSV